jgi:hypothetical protein
MTTEVSEIADRVYRLSTFVPKAGPAGFTFNQFLIDAEEPLLFHCGQRSLFPTVAEAARRVLDLARLRWISFSHVEADECGALEPWLAAVPQAQPTHNKLGCTLWLNDISPRPPVARKDGDLLDLGGRRVRWLDTPHLPHNWEAGLLFEEVTGTLFWRPAWVWLRPSTCALRAQAPEVRKCCVSNECFCGFSREHRGGPSDADCSRRGWRRVWSVAACEDMTYRVDAALEYLANGRRATL